MEEILASRNRQRRYPWMPYALWQADGIVFGHFLSPASDDAAISGFGAEGHPQLSGGTLLFTRNRGMWNPVWYRSGVITRHCRRIALATGRQILFCEQTDGGMGHSLHGLYVVDLAKPEFAWRSTVLMADSYSSFLIGGVQAQFIGRVAFERNPAQGLLVKVYARHGSARLPLEDQDRLNEEALPRPKIRAYRIEFRLDGEALRVTRETAAAGRLFNAK